jgi:hypothetical protein
MPTWFIWTHPQTSSVVRSQLNLDDNNFHGRFVDRILALRELTYLNLGNNKFSGSLSLDDLTNLEFLVLEHIGGLHDLNTTQFLPMT